MKKYILRAVVFVFLVLFIPNAYAESFDDSAWLFKAPLEVKETSADDLVYLYLRRPVLAIAKLSPNIRIIDNNDKEIAYTTYNTQSKKALDIAEVYDMSSKGEEKSFIVDTNPGNEIVIHNSIDLNIQGENFKRQVLVYASDTRIPISSSEWRLLTRDGYIYNYSDPKAGLYSSGYNVSYPKSGSRFLKVVVLTGEGHIGNIDSVGVSKASENFRAMGDVFTTQLHYVTDEKAKVSIVTISFDKLEVVRSVTVGVMEDNFDRRVSVEYQSEGGQWIGVSPAYFFGIKNTDLVKKQLTVSFPDVSATALRLTVVNYDDNPLSFLPESTVISPQVRIIFRAKPGEYNLFAGSQKASIPRYDIDRTIGDLSNAKEVSLGLLVSNPAYVPEVAQEAPFSERYAFIFDILLVVLVFSLGVFLLFYLRRINKVG